MNPNEIGAFISELRREKGLTQIALAEKLNVSNRAVSKWENGDGMPDVTMLPVLAEFFGITVDEILAGKRNVVDRPEPLFVIEGKNSKNDILEAYRTFLNSKFGRFQTIALIICPLVLIASLYIIDVPNKSAFVVLVSVVVLMYLLLRLVLPRFAANKIFQDRQSMHSSDEYGRMELSDKIYVDSSHVNEMIEFSSISAVLESKNLLVVVLGRGHFLGLNKHEITKGNLEELRGFLKSKVNPNKKEIRQKKITTVLLIIMIAISVALIPLDIITLAEKSKKYDPVLIEERCELFTSSRNEFDRSLNKIKNDPDIQKELEEEDYFCSWAEDYIAIKEVLDIEVGKDYVSFSTSDNEDCYSGYVYVECDDMPYPYQIGFDHADIENQSFNYIAKDDVYLLGKENNNRSNAEAWYLIKILDDNWYYYEYY